MSHTRLAAAVVAQAIESMRKYPQADERHKDAEQWLRSPWSVFWCDAAGFDRDVLVEGLERRGRMKGKVAA